MSWNPLLGGRIVVTPTGAGTPRFAGAARALDDFLFLNVGNGAGMGVFLRGALYRGYRNAAGEAGHVIVDEDSQSICTCGNRGCLEALASATAIKREALEALRKHPQSELYKRYHHDPQAVTAEMVYQCAQAGDPASRKIFQDGPNGRTAPAGDEPERHSAVR